MCSARLSSLPLTAFSKFAGFFSFSCQTARDAASEERETEGFMIIKGFRCVDTKRKLLQNRPG